jgi:hypothetical protein
MSHILKGMRYDRVNWTRISSRNRMQRQVVEDIKGKTPLGGQPPKIRRRLSKADESMAEAAKEGKKALGHFLAKRAA